MFLVSKHNDTSYISSEYHSQINLFQAQIGLDVNMLKLSSTINPGCVKTRTVFVYESVDPRKIIQIQMCEFSYTFKSVRLLATLSRYLPKVRMKLRPFITSTATNYYLSFFWRLSKGNFGFYYWVVCLCELRLQPSQHSLPLYGSLGRGLVNCYVPFVDCYVPASPSKISRALWTGPGSPSCLPILGKWIAAKAYTYSLECSADATSAEYPKYPMDSCVSFQKPRDCLPSGIASV